MIDMPVKITNQGGDADEHRIRLADVAEMYAGFGRAASYCLLSLEAGVLIERATRGANVQVYQRRTADQCIIHDIVVEIAQHPGSFYAGIVGAIGANYLQKFLDFCFKGASDLLTDKEYDEAIKTYDRIEPFFDDLTEKLEPHLLAVHAPIVANETITVNLGATEIKFDKSTRDFLEGANISRKRSKLRGVVTRLNIVTGNGRFYSEDVGRIVPFSQKVEMRNRPASKHLSWSLRQRDQGRLGEIEITVLKVTSNTDRLKRLIIQSAKRARAED